jgi:membrane protein YqaA with SNARE-associated domain
MATGMTRVKAWSARIAESRHGLMLIFIASFLEAIIVPIPLELVLIPYMLKERQRVWIIATVTLLGCMLAATVGYYVGVALFDTVGTWLLETLNYSSQFEDFRKDFQANGFWTILIIGVVPIPFQAAMLAAGATGYPLLLFWLAATIARGIRYYGLALLVVLFGRQALTLWHSLSKKVGFGLLVLVVVVYGLIKWA